MSNERGTLPAVFSFLLWFMSGSVRKPHLLKRRLLHDQPKNERLPQTTHFSVRRALVFLIVLSPILLLVSALETLDPAEKLQQATGVDVQNLPQGADEIRTQYLKREWATLFKQNKYLGPPITVIDVSLTFLSPLFAIILGVPYAFSWLFTFALLLWLILFVLLFPVTSALFERKLLGALAATIIASLAGTAGGIKKAADLLATIITQRWLAWISFILALIILAIASLLGKNFKKLIKKEKESAAKEQEKHDRAILHKEAEIAREDLDSRRDGKD